ncbi:MAG TPA: DUF4157 domain-containing protein [Chthoniobacterales bacterium]|nr:DUF4157 domain-containing protein [Chthoniobacterales bacterium]
MKALLKKQSQAKTERLIPSSVASQRKDNTSSAESQHQIGVPATVPEVLRSLGQPLDYETRAFMEPRFGHDFSLVRLHNERHAQGSGTKGEPPTRVLPRFADVSKRIPSHPNAYSTIQPKLQVDTSGSAEEQEADRIAEEVMRMPEPQLSSGAGSGCKDEQASRVPLQTKRVKAHGSREVAAPPIVDEVIHSAGQPLAPSTREFMEPRFGHDFSWVRVHTDARAVQAVSAVNARAFAVDRNIAFGVGEYAPQTATGRRLLSHELTHVLQQRSSDSKPLVTGAPLVVGGTSSVLQAAPSAAITLSKGVGVNGPNVVTDLKQIQAKLLEMGFLSPTDYTLEGVTLLKELKDTDKVGAKNIPKTIAAIKQYQRVVEYRDDTSKYNKPTGQISLTGISLSLMNAQIAAPTQTELTAISKNRGSLSSTVKVGGELKLTGKVGRVSDGNNEGDLTAVQQRLSAVGKLDSKDRAVETPAAIKTKYFLQYKTGIASIDQAHIPKTIKAIEKFQTEGQFEHKYWSRKKFAGQDLGTLTWTSGVVAEGGLSEFILSHYQELTFGFKDDKRVEKTVSAGNFQRAGSNTKDAVGVSILGTAEPASFTVDEFKTYGITDVEVSALLFVSKNEGKFNGLNTYDRTAITFGFVQFAGGSGGGTFPKLLANLKKDSPTVFEERFQKYGIDVEYVENQSNVSMATVVAIDPAGGKVMRGRDAEEYIRKMPALLPAFLTAGHSKEVQQAQVKTAVSDYVIPSRNLKFDKNSSNDVLKYKKDKKEVLLVGKEAETFAKSPEYMALPPSDKEALTTFSLIGEKISDYLSSEKSRAVIIDLSINKGLSGGATAISQGMGAYIVANKQISKGALKAATETDILASIQPFASIPSRVEKAINDASLSGS